MLLCSKTQKERVISMFRCINGAVRDVRYTYINVHDIYQ